jgi:hypothetical protein
LPEGLTLLLLADIFNGLSNGSEVTPQDSLQKRALVWEVLI